MVPGLKQLFLNSMKDIFLEGPNKRLLLGLQFFQIHFLILQTIPEDLVGRVAQRLDALWRGSRGDCFQETIKGKA